ncbi:serine O-acetyltransferase [Pseudomonas duriflava]|uniref:Serine acetyltransferase n=1 Tax=Pseudomonas duriflava TaxID=459528 RepID=A0A562QLA4_9PSED|nr:serine O-acetyltransferase [Pseudomonas duriflava]TWI57531.1 serine O-acetyltransferase [Pseudomonas duriflava]
MTSSLLAAERWSTLRRMADDAIGREPALAPWLTESILTHDELGAALAFRVSHMLNIDPVQREALTVRLATLQQSRPAIAMQAWADLEATVSRDPAFDSMLEVFLFSKGFLAIQAYRMAHPLWLDGHRMLALYIQARCNEALGVDIHPASRIGQGIMFDHGTGIVIGETAVIEDDVSILQSVTLGGTGKECGDRHPKVRRGVMIGAGAKILGNIEIGEGAKVGAGSVVLKPVAPHTTVVGNPARPVGTPRHDQPALVMDQSFDQD